MLAASMGDSVARHACRPAGTPSRLGACECLKQAVEKSRLAFQNFRMRLVDAKPSGAVKFRELLTPPGSWRPFYFEHIAFKASGLPVAFDGPYVNNLSSRPLFLAERPRFAARPMTRLFRELPLCGGDSPSAIRPFGIDHDARSLLRQKRDDRAKLRYRRLNAGKARDLHSVCRMWPVSPTR
jgi:hypothetical protein